MKRYLLFVSVIIILTSCSSYKKEKVTTQNTEIQKIDITTGKELFFDMEGYCDIFYFDSKQILFTNDGEVNRELDATNKLFYNLNLENNITTFITEVQNVNFSTQDIVFLNNHLYYPLSIKSEQGLIEHILEISLDNFSIRIKKSSVIDSVVTRLEMANNMIFRYYQRNLGVEETDFFIDNLGLLDSEKNIIYKKYIDFTGEILVSMCTYEHSIYTFSLICDEVNRYAIREYSLTGNLLKEYQIDLEEFLKLKEVDDTDIAYQIYREGEYIILSTLNGRIKIYKIEDNKLVDIEVPEEFEKMFGARVVENNGELNGYIYFRSTDDNNDFYIFDTANCKFSEFKVLTNELHLQHVIRSSNGDVIFITGNDDFMPNTEYKYFLFDFNQVLNLQ